MKLTAYFCSCLFLILCLTSKCIGQKHGQERIDSLSECLKNYKSICTQPCIGDSSKVRTLLLLGSIYALRNQDSASLLNQEALQFAEQINWQFGIAACYHSMGYSFARIGQYDSALLYYNKTLGIASQIEKSGTAEEKLPLKFQTPKHLAIWRLSILTKVII